MPSRSLFRRTALLAAGLAVATSFANPASATARAKAPSITKLSATAGPLAGGTLVTITGAGFTEVSKVTFGTAPGAAVHVVSATKLTVKTPKHRAGTVAVSVATKAGRSAAKSAARFSYLPRPSVTLVAPNSGSTFGGTKVTITGTGFSHVSGVYFGAKPGHHVSVASAKKLTVFTPSGFEGDQYVTVATPGGKSPNVVSKYFNYTPPYTPLTWQDTTITPPASDPSGEDYGAYDVSCGAVGSCMALAGYPGSPAFDFISVLKNGVWTSSTPPAISDEQAGFVTAFTKVVCLSDTFCAAAGTYRQSGTGLDRAVVATWNGTAWSTATPARDSSEIADEQAIKDLACSSPAACVAVGWTNGSGEKTPLADALSGSTWSQQSVQTPVAQYAAHPTSQYAAVACPAAGACVAAGTYLNTDNRSLPLLGHQRSNGFDASTPGLPFDASAQGNAVMSTVACASATDCHAAGWYSTPFGTHELSVQYDGAGWYANETGPPVQGGGAANVELSASGCMTFQDCYAVGYFDGSGVDVTGEVSDLNEDFESPAPFPSGTPATVDNSQLDGISCVATDCVSVGQYYDPSANITHGWIDEVLTDDSVKAIEAPRPATSKGAFLASVSCISEHYCVSVGRLVDSGNTGHALVEVGSA